jgi:hypothetical protein
MFPLIRLEQIRLEQILLEQIASEMPCPQTILPRNSSMWRCGEILVRNQRLKPTACIPSNCIRQGKCYRPASTPTFTTCFTGGVTMELVSFIAAIASS